VSGISFSKHETLSCKRFHPRVESTTYEELSQGLHDPAKCRKKDKCRCTQKAEMGLMQEGFEQLCATKLGHASEGHAEQDSSQQI
jgi:hypothetical protein